MIPDAADNPSADIAYMKSLAHQGRNAPLIHGPILVAAGTIFGTASLIQWTIQAGVLVVDPMAQLWVWLAAGVLFGVALAVLLRRSARKAGFAGVINQSTGVAWSGVGFIIFAVWLAMLVIGFVEGNWEFMRLMPSLVFAAYGAAWTVSAAMTGQKWMNAVALLAFAGAVALGPLSNQAAGYLVFVALLLLVVLFPGLYLMRREAAGRA